MGKNLYKKLKVGGECEIHQIINVIVILYIH